VNGFKCVVMTQTLCSEHSNCREYGPNVQGFCLVELDGSGNPGQCLYRTSESLEPTFQRALSNAELRRAEVEKEKSPHEYEMFRSGKGPMW